MVEAPALTAEEALISRRRLLIWLGATSGLSACSVDPRNPDIGALYQYTSDIDPVLRRPLVTIPGLLGSRLRSKSTGEFVWGGPSQVSVDPGAADGARQLALPIGQGDEPLDQLRDDNLPAGVLRKANARALFVTVQQQAYSNLTRILNSGGYEFSQTEEEESSRRGNNPGSLEFPYDWRRDIVESARELDDFIERKAKQIERVRTERYGRSIPAEKIRFDFIAHSMGGLVLRYWLMYGAGDLPPDGSLPKLTWAGAKRAACVIFIAPPNLGSISALGDLTTGRSLGAFQPFYPPGLLGTLPALYQLMPRSRHNRLSVAGETAPVSIDIYDPVVWRENGWGLLNPEEDRFLSILMPEAGDRIDRERRAFGHVAKALARAEQLHRALDVTGTPSATDLFLIVGTGLDTPAAAQIDPDTRAVSISAQEEGDGVVLRSSALREESLGGVLDAAVRRPLRYRTTLLLPGEHVDITASPVLADNLLYWLLDQPRRRLSPPAEPEPWSAIEPNNAKGP